MTTGFEDRERAAEWAIAHEGEVRLLAHCTALKTLATHAAAQMGLVGEAADAYARDVVGASVDGAKDEALLERVRADLEAHGVVESTDGLRQRLAQALAQIALDARKS